MWRSEVNLHRSVLSPRGFSELDSGHQALPAEPSGYIWVCGLLDSSSQILLFLDLGLDLLVPLYFVLGWVSSE